jgi:hypothetical protein
LPKLEAVAERVGDVGPLDALDCLVGRGDDPLGAQARDQLGEAVDDDPGCAFRAGLKGSSTPTWSSAAPARNQQPPR